MAERRLGLWIMRICTALVALALLIGAYLAWFFLRDEPETFADPEMQFKYGSTGGDRNFGLPYEIWAALPVLFRDKLPEGRQDEGWAAFGFIFEPDAPLRRPRPVGTSLRRHLGMDRIFLNCAGCHATRVRATPNGPPLIAAGGPSNTVDLGAFQDFLAAAAVDERFTAGDFISQIDSMGLDMGLIENLALRIAGVAIVRERLLSIVDRFDDFVGHEPEFGPGRFDTFNPARVLMNYDFAEVPEEARIGVVDFPSVWMQGPKTGMRLHWDGNNDKVSERNRSAAFGTGATPPLLDRESLARFEAWLATAEPPRFTDVFPDRFDKALAERGAAIYAAECAECHGASGRDFSGEYVGKVTPIDEIATDRGRLDNYTRDLALNQNMLYAGWGDERFQRFRKTNGYANMPLDGLWLRAPYLHGGSVPTLADLLERPENRPAAFLRGGDLYDPERMGFESRPSRIPPGTAAHLFCYVTRAGGEALCPARVPEMRGACADGPCRGNGAEGHLYGTDLPPEDKRALIEHLKTF